MQVPLFARWAFGKLVLKVNPALPDCSQEADNATEHGEEDGKECDTSPVRRKQSLVVASKRTVRLEHATGGVEPGSGGGRLVTGLSAPCDLALASKPSFIAKLLRTIPPVPFALRTSSLTMSAPRCSEDASGVESLDHLVPLEPCIRPEDLIQTLGSRTSTDASPSERIEALHQCFSDLRRSSELSDQHLPMLAHAVLHMLVPPPVSKVRRIAVFYDDETTYNFESVVEWINRQVSGVELYVQPRHSFVARPEEVALYFLSVNTRVEGFIDQPRFDSLRSQLEHVGMRERAGLHEITVLCLLCWSERERERERECRC